MREILFRGKRIDNGEWVDGDLMRNDDEDFPMTLIGSLILSRDKPDNHISLDGYCLYEVDLATIGQYTELKDINGKSIFEGDIFTDADNECVGVVRWHNGSFKIFWYGLDGVMMSYGYDECAGKVGVLEVETFDDVYVNQMEVIGNIHDNPELLKKADDA